MLRNCLNSILMAESTAQLKVEPYERSEERTDSRNGTREPNEESLLRLMGYVLLEWNEVVSAQKALFSPESYQAILTSDAVSKLAKLADEQVQLRAP